VVAERHTMSKISIMIVDDERLVIEDMISLFDWEKNGFEIVATPGNGKIAYEQYLKLKPQVIITDIRMPLMDGMDLIREIRKTDSQTKILLLSAYSDFHYAKRAIGMGITDYMLKNEVNEDTLKNKLLSIRRQIIKENNASFIISQKLMADMFSARYSYAGNQYGEEMRFLLNTPYFYMIVQENLPMKIANNMPQSRHIGLEMVSHCYMENCEDVNNSFLITNPKLRLQTI